MSDTEERLVHLTVRLNDDGSVSVDRPGESWGWRTYPADDPMARHWRAILLVEPV